MSSIKTDSNNNMKIIHLGDTTFIFDWDNNFSMMYQKLNNPKYPNEIAYVEMNKGDDEKDSYTFVLNGHNHAYSREFPFKFIEDEQ